jgi:hypothetical protein
MLAIAGNITFADLTGVETTGHDRSIRGGDHATNPVTPKKSLTGCRTDLSEDNKRAFRIVHTQWIAFVVEVHSGEEKKIGETQISEKSP